MRESLAEYKNDEKICFAFCAVFQVPFLRDFFQFQSRVALGHSLSNGSLLKKPKNEHFFTPLRLRGDDRASKSSFESALFSAFFLHKKEAHTKLK